MNFSRMSRILRTILDINRIIKQVHVSHLSHLCLKRVCLKSIVLYTHVHSARKIIIHYRNLKLKHSAF